MASEVLYRCARVDCEGLAVVDLKEEWADSRHAPRDLTRQHLPDGWDYDRVGEDEVLHCPEHRVVP